MNEPEMLIIISAARSGSKFLRDLLAASPECAVLPFDVNYVWRFGNERRPDDALPAAAADGPGAEFIRRSLPRMAGIRSDSDRRMVVEKTVSNALRVPFVARIFPRARYVHLVRDGRAVAESARRVWDEPVDRGYLLRKARYFPVRNYRYAIWYLQNGLHSIAGRSRSRVWGPRYPGIDADLATLDRLVVCAKQWSSCVESACRDLGGLPPERVFTLRYEDLASRANSLASLCQFAGIRDSAPVMAAYRQRVETGKLDRWQSSLTASDRATIESVSGAQLRALGYLT